MTLPPLIDYYYGGKLYSILTTYSAWYFTLRKEYVIYSNQYKYSFTINYVFQMELESLAGFHSVRERRKSWVKNFISQFI